jgi:Core-2/I-Branching enzyme
VASQHCCAATAALDCASLSQPCGTQNGAAAASIAAPPQKELRAQTIPIAIPGGGVYREGWACHGCLFPRLSLARSHAALVAADEDANPTFARECWIDAEMVQLNQKPSRFCVSDEHYIPTLLALHGKQRVEPGLRGGTCPNQHGAVRLPSVPSPRGRQARRDITDTRMLLMTAK